MMESFAKKSITLIVLLSAFLVFSMWGCASTEEDINKKTSDEAVDISEYTFEREEERYLKTRISEATAVYYKSTANGEYGLDEAIFERTKIPEGYLEVEYVEANGREFIDTEIAYADDLVLDLVFSDYSTNALEGSIVGTDGYLYTLGRTDTNQIAWLSSENLIYGYSAFSQYKRYTVHCEKYRFVVNGGDTLPIQNPIETQASHNLWIFRGANGYASCKLYSMKISKGNAVVANFIPCIRESDQCAGLYDIAREKFYEASESQSEYEPAEYYADLPTDYIQVEYIEGLGEQYADTGLRITAEMSGELRTKMQFLSDEPICWSGADYCFQYTYTYFNSMDIIDVFISYEDYCQNIYRNGSLVVTNDWASRNIDQKTMKIGIFRLGAENEGWLSYIENYNYSTDLICQKARLYSLSIVIEGNLKADYLPCVRKADGCTGLYDKVSGKFLEVVGCKYGSEVFNPDTDDFSKRYERLEYVHMDGTEGFYTGTSGYAKYTFDIEFTQVTGTRQLMGYSHCDENYWGIDESGNHAGCVQWTRADGSYCYANGREIIADCYEDGMIYRYFNGELVASFQLDETDIDIINNSNYCIGVLPIGNEMQFPCSINLYELTVEQNGEVVKRFLPVKRKSDGCLGLYEEISNKFTPFSTGKTTLIPGEQTGHYFDDGVVISERSESHEGDTLYTCKACGKQYHKIEDCLSYKATFELGDGIESVIVYKGYDYSEFAENDVAYTRNKNTNNFSKNDGEIRFSVRLKEGYVLSEVSASGTEEIIKNDDIFIVSAISEDFKIAITAEKK